MEIHSDVRAFERLAVFWQDCQADSFHPHSISARRASQRLGSDVVDKAGNARSKAVLEGDALKIGVLKGVVEQGGRQDLNVIDMLCQQCSNGPGVHDVGLASIELAGPGMGLGSSRICLDEEGMGGEELQA